MLQSYSGSVRLGILDVTISLQECSPQSVGGVFLFPTFAEPNELLIFKFITL